MLQTVKTRSGSWIEVDGDRRRVHHDATYDETPLPFPTTEGVDVAP